MDIETAIKYMTENGTKVEKLPNGKYKMTNQFGVSIKLTEGKFIEFVQEYKEIKENVDNEDYCHYTNKKPHWTYYMENPIEDE